MPCHPGTYIAGTVTDAVSHQAIYNATVHLYHYETQTAPSGCFALGGADALPFEFRVSAPGYRPVVVEAIPGSYQATVTLVPEVALVRAVRRSVRFPRTDIPSSLGAAPNNSFKPKPLRGSA